MADVDRFEILDEQVDDLLENGSLPNRETADPLLFLAKAVHEALPHEQPSEQFRARLKSELLERYANNVRPFPSIVQKVGASQSPSRIRVRQGLIAFASAVAAVFALLVGYGALHQRTATNPTSPVAQLLATSTLSPTQSAHVLVPSYPWSRVPLWEMFRQGTRR